MEWKAQDNIRRTLHIVDEAQQKKKQSIILVSINVEKAFDRVNLRFLYQVLERFGFNSESVQCIKTLYQQPTIKIKINGRLTDEINLQRSLFALLVEPLAQAVRQNEELERVTGNGTEHKIGLSADDVMAFLEKPNRSLLVLMKLLETYRI